ncbi:MAG: co-chaperone GroES family protein [bacterium]
MAIHEGDPSLTDGETGIVMPQTVQLCNDWYGVVIGLADDLEGGRLRFGDVVQLSRWRGKWFNRPLETMLGDPRPNGEYLAVSPDGGRRIKGIGRYKWCFLRPSDILFQLGDEIKPVGDRVLVLHEEKDEEAAPGIIDPHFMRGENTLARVMAVGDVVSEVVPGDWVLVKPLEGAQIQRGKDRFSSIHERDVLMVVDERPKGRTEYVQDMSLLAPAGYRGS